MKTIICGAGEVGYSIADKLSKEGFEVTVIDVSKDSLKKISDKFSFPKIKLLISLQLLKIDKELVIFKFSLGEKSIFFVFLGKTTF